MKRRIPRSEFRLRRLAWLCLHTLLFVAMYMYTLTPGRFTFESLPQWEQLLYLAWIWPTGVVYALTAWLLPSSLAMWLGFALTMWLYYRWARRRNELRARHE